MMTLLDQLTRQGGGVVQLNNYDRHVLAEEVRALRAGRPVPLSAPSYKGVTYREGKWYDKALEVGSANVFEALCRYFDVPTDADHHALMALKEETERVVTLESIIKEEIFASESFCKNLASKIRRAFPHIEQPRELTVAECVGRLVELGATSMIAEREMRFGSRVFDKGCRFLFVPEAA